MSPLARLVERGDIVEVIRGRLTIIPKSGRPIPDQWFKENENLLVLDMANLTNQLYLSYTGFDCGKYGKHKAGGLYLKLSNLADTKACYTIFNAGVERQRDSKNGMAGTRLPANQFTITKRQDFYMFWVSAGLKIPNRSLSRLWGYMGNLKPLHFTGSYDSADHKQEKILTRTLKVLNISYKTLLDSGEFIHNPCTAHSRTIHTAYTSSIHKEVDASQNAHSIQPALTTGSNSHDRRLKGKEVNGNPYSPLIQSMNNITKRPQDQTRDEWLADYIEEGNNPTFYLATGKHEGYGVIKTRNDDDFTPMD
jgi:hypothetical protein